MSPSGRIWVHYRVRKLKYLLKLKQTLGTDYFGQNRNLKNEILKPRLCHRNQHKNLVSNHFWSENMHYSSAIAIFNFSFYKNQEP